MSELKVDKISPKTGTAMTVGDSGDTFTVPSGATLTVAGALNVTGTTSLADGTVAVAELDIDGATDFGAAIGDADLFVIDDGAGGANRKTAASRIKTYVTGDNSIDSDQYVDGSIDNAHIADDQIDSEHYAAGSVDLEHMSSQSVDEDNLYISNAGSNGQYLSKQSGNNGGLTWASVVGTITALNNATANELVTVGSTTTELDAESLLTFTGTVFTLGVGTSVVNSGTWSPGTVSTGKALVLGI